MGKHLVAVLTTVNAPHSKQLDGEELAHCLSDITVAKQYADDVSAFLGGVPAALQISFAKEFGIPIGDLEAFASSFSKWTGESYQLATCDWPKLTIGALPSGDD